MSADPLEVHAPGEADANLYAYVEAKALARVDPIGLKEDDPNNKASQGTIDALKSFMAPIYESVLATPNLRPKEIEVGVLSGTIPGKHGHPHSTFRGAWGEALIGDWCKPFCYVWRQVPGDTLPPIIEQAVGKKLPDFAWVQLAGYNIETRWVGVVGRETNGRVDVINWGNKPVFSIWEVTTTGLSKDNLRRREQQLNWYEDRARKVAGWARRLRGHGVRAVLGMDRGIYFRMSESERSRIRTPIVSAGGYIRLFPDLARTVNIKVEESVKRIKNANGVNTEPPPSESGTPQQTPVDLKNVLRSH